MISPILHNTKLSMWQGLYFQEYWRIIEVMNFDLKYNHKNHVHVSLKM
jgi:hypothetical protein